MDALHRTRPVGEHIARREVTELAARGHPGELLARHRAEQGVSAQAVNEVLGAHRFSSSATHTSLSWSPRVR